MTPARDTPLDTPEAFRRRARYVVALVALTAVGLFVLWTTREAVLLGFLGVAVGVLFYHLSRWVADRTPVPRRLALVAVVLGVVGTVAAVGWLAGPRLMAQAQVLIAAAPAVLEAARERLGVSESVLSMPAALGELSGRLLGWFSTVAGVLTGAVVVLVVAVYTAASPARYTASVARLVDAEHQPFVRDMLHEMGLVLMAWLKGVGVAVTVLFAMAYVGLLLIGVPGALALAALIGVMTVIPIFGPIVGWAPALVVAFAEGTTTGAWTLGLALVTQQIEGDLITPKMQGEMVSVPPAFVVGGQIVLGALAGFLGILLVVPILGVGLVAVRRLYIGPFVAGEPADPDDAPPPAEPTAEPSAASD